MASISSTSPSLQAPKQSPGMIIGAVVNSPTPQVMQVKNISTVSTPGILPIVPPTLGMHGAAAGPSMAARQAEDVTSTNMANTKEKTPMCLINELARFNKIQHQYTLTDEQGPAHKKTFYVKLKLGEEEYAASGPSIKKAQHAAAGVALEKTKYKHPPPKMVKSYPGGDPYECDGTITPTVELNALAMKRGEPAIYRPIEPQRPQYYPPPNLDFRGMYNQRYHYPRFPRMFYVSLKVGQREFIGEGTTRQMARHSAATKAIKVLNTLPMPALTDLPPGASGGEAAVNDENGQCPYQSAAVDAGDEMKSEISLVYEIALKRNLTVTFEVIRESGPPHMRNFVTRCICNDLVSDGEGNSKKLSKQRAAEKMLEELRKLPVLPPSIPKSKRPPVVKKKTRNLIKVSFQLQKASPEYGVGINPISRLIQIQQARKEKEPIYTLLAERGLPRKREFVMQVAVGESVCSGTGPNKKLAKRAAAEAMLQLLGYSRPSPQPNKPAIKSQDAQSAADKKVTFLDHLDQEKSHPRQLVPGVLLMPEGSRTNGGWMNQQGMNRVPGSHIVGMQYSPQVTATIAQELLDKGTSPTAEGIVQVGSKTLTHQMTVRPKQQLLYLTEVLGLQVQFTDFPKVTNKTEFLSLVSLSTNPPQVSHGAGQTIEESHDNAALTALQSLAKIGIDLVNKPAQLGAGDGPYVKPENLVHSSLGSGAIKAEPN